MRRMNDVMDPQIFVYEKKKADTPVTDFPSADVTIEQTSGIDLSLSYRLQMKWGFSRIDYIDTNAVYVSPGRYWTIGVDSLKTDLRLNLGIKYRFEADSLPPLGDLGLVHRKDSTERWQVYPKISVDTSKNTVTAIDVEGFSDWALAAVKPGSTVGVAEVPSGAPVAFRLLQNYPNPFNPATTIEFSVPRSGPVSLTLYDVLGRQVRTILDENLQAGHHRVRLEAKDLASGVYIYRLHAAGSVALKKLMLLK